MPTPTAPFAPHRLQLQFNLSSREPPSSRSRSDTSCISCVVFGVFSILNFSSSRALFWSPFWFKPLTNRTIVLHLFCIACESKHQVNSGSLFRCDDRYCQGTGTRRYSVLRTASLHPSELEQTEFTMSSVRVVARVRPLLKSERDVDVILHTGSKHILSSKTDRNSQDTSKLAALRDRDTLVRIPNPKNENEEYSFQFNAVYEAEASQQELFEAEGS